jgi:hypothetical protein
MAVYHILNGDALTDRFLLTGLPGETVIMKECLIEGPLDGETLLQFWKTRSKFIDESYGGDYSGVLNEMNKILRVSFPAEFNLWFGYDLFCQTNLWFLLSLIHNLNMEIKVSIVYPSFLRGVNIWKEFGQAGKNDLIASFHEKIVMPLADIELGKQLWDAYKANDLIKLEKLSYSTSKSFPFLREVCTAHIQRFENPGRPEKVIGEIIQAASPDFQTVFEEFCKREGIYGFGDSQLRKIYDKLIIF